MELEAAIFDMGGVLTTPILESFLAFERSVGLPEHTLIRSMFSHRTDPDGEPDFYALETGRMSEVEYYRRLADHLEREMGVRPAFPEDPVEMRRGLWGAIRRNEEMIAAVRAIAPHYKVGMLTNNVKEWADWRESYPVELFDVLIDSCEVGLRKPDPEIFLLACARLGVEPSRASFVDDVPAYVEAARAVGLKAFVFTTTEEVLTQLRPHFPRAFPAAEPVA